MGQGQIKPQMTGQNERDGCLPPGGLKEPLKPCRDGENGSRFQEAEFQKQITIEPSSGKRGPERRVAIQEYLPRDEEIAGQLLDLLDRVPAVGLSGDGGDRLRPIQLAVTDI